jgi:acid phosphatase family membrane protein YuiD
MKRILLSAFCLLLSVVAVFADDVITVNTGSETSQFAINEIEKIVFGEDAIVVKEKSGTETPFNYDAISEITFDYVSTGIQNVSLPDVLPLEAEGCEVYSISGHKMNPNALPNGVYIIKKGNKVTKFIKR